MKGTLRGALIVLLLSAVTLRASDHTGKVTLTGVSIPGATVTAKQGTKTVATITDLFGGADWHERETWEMFGFDFVGHPGLRHLYLPGAFEGFPLRKDFPLLAREIKPWPGLVDKEPMPGEDAEGDEEGGGDE